MRSQLPIKFTTLKVKELTPLQKEISLKKLLKLHSGIDNYSPIVTLNSKYIIDGHHRWASIYSLNPNLSIDSYNIVLDVSPRSLLDKFKSTFKSKEKSNKHNLFNLNSKEILSRIKDSYSSKSSSKSILNNLLRLKTYNSPTKGSISRSYMPQINTNI